MSSYPNNFEVIIVGGGPAGMSAAITCAELGIEAILFEREAELGGQLLWTYNAIENYPPFKARTGRELRDHFLQRVENVGARYLTNAVVKHLDLEKRIVILGNGDRYSARSIILATGVRRRMLNVPGEQEFRGKGILESGIKDKEQVRGKTVVIVGGGDAALENACILGEVAKKVIVVHRRNQFSARSGFVEAARKLNNVEFMYGRCVKRIFGESKVTAVELQELKSTNQSIIDTDAVLIRIGVEPNTELIAGQLDIDEAGFVVRKSSLESKSSAIFAAGDIANPNDLTILAAVRDGVNSANGTKI